MTRINDSDNLFAAMGQPLELIGIRVTKETKLALEKKAESEDRPLSNYLRRLLEAHVADGTKKKARQ